MAIATLSIDLEARLARFQQGMQRAEGLLLKLERSAATAGQRIGEIFTGALGAELATAALTRLVQLFPQVISGTLAIKDLAEATGSTVGNISALDDIVRRAGGTFETVEGVLVKFNAGLKEADGRNGISQALRAIGLDAAKLRQLDPAEALLATAQALESFADDGNRARLTQELFGKSVREAAPFLRDLAEAGRLNATVTDEQAEAVDRFDKNMARLRTNLVELARAVSEGPIQKLNEVFVRVDALQRTYGSISSGLLANLGARGFTDAAEGVTFYSSELARLQKQLDDLNRTGLPLQRVITGGRIEKEIESARKALEFYQRVGVATGSVTGGEFRTPPEVSKPRLPALAGATAQAAKQFDDYTTSVNKSLGDLISKTPTVKLAELNAQLERLQQLADGGLDPALVAEVRNLLLPPSGPDVGPPLSEELKRVNELLQQTNTAQLNAASKDVALLREEFDKTTAGTRRWLELADAILDVETRIDSLTGALPELQQETDKAAEQMRDTIEGALGSTLSTALRGEFRSIGELWKNLLVDMAARALAADIMGALFKNSGTSSGAGNVSLIDTVLKFIFSAKGNVFAGGLTPFAMGGVVNGATPFAFRGGLGVMGEAGPEAILPLKRGPGGQLGVMSNGGGGQRVQIVNHVTVQGGASRNDVMQAMAIAEQRAVASIQDAMRRGRMAPAGA
jgi:hypothetical protein